MANTLDSYTKSYNSFSGADIIVTFNSHVIGELQGVSYTIQREKGPQYVLGNADPISFSRGKRGIAGSLVFLMLDRSAMLDAFSDSMFLAWKHDYAAIVGVDNIIDVAVAGLDGTEGYTGSVGSDTTSLAATVTLDKVLARPIYHDQILPFEIVISAVNEYGANSFMKIHGVEIINVGSGFSVDDMQIDEACTFVCRAITSWKPGTQVTIAGFTLPTTIG